MTAVKDAPRPASQHRPSFSFGPASLPRNSYTRPSPYSASPGSINPVHRITRRKSSTLSPAAINAAVNAIEADGEDGGKAIHRRSVQSRVALGSVNSGSYPSPPNSLPQSGQFSKSSVSGNSALVDGPSLSSMSDKVNKNRLRRASDGSTLSSKKKGGNGDLKCETCGKAYKHSSCLTKHLWEHTPEWTITSKLLISKHQQVQLLEAASVLVAMNADGPDTIKNSSSDSDNSSASPAASGSSDREDDLSSAETTPPPQNEEYRGHRKQLSTASSGYSRSYQSVFSTSEGQGSRPADYQLGRQWSSSSNRPVTAGTSVGGSYTGREDQADLAAAVGLLSCSYGTPQNGPSALSSGIPPVPPVPERYQKEARRDADVDMEEISEEEDDDTSRSRADDEEEIFGQMEE